ncbi:MAG: hypothetical protein ABSE77_15425 [Acidimicrobiales bacterium]|jgi:hypothetical protein
MLDLPDPDARGARRVRDAGNWLKEHQLVRVEHVRGKEPKVYLLSALGNGALYSRPGLGERYVRMPVAFWQNGWIVVLSGAALAMWLVIAEMQGGRKPSEVWATPLESRRRYRLSEDTFTKGTRELESHGLLSVTKQPQGAEQWLYNRLRNSYWLEYGRLEERTGGTSRTPLDNAPFGLTDEFPYNAPFGLPDEFP